MGIKKRLTSHYSGPGERMRPDGTTPVAGPLSLIVMFPRRDNINEHP